MDSEIRRKKIKSEESLRLPKCVCSVRCVATGVSVYQIKNPGFFLTKQVVSNIFLSGIALQGKDFNHVMGMIAHFCLTESGNTKIAFPVEVGIFFR